MRAALRNTGPETFVQPILFLLSISPGFANTVHKDGTAFDSQIEGIGYHSNVYLPARRMKLPLHVGN